MAALQSRALAGAGFDVLQIDLLGCGDSSGDFGDATWEAWVNDVVQGCQWLRAHRGKGGAAGGAAQPALWLWGLRAGCLLAAEAAARLAEPCNFLFWQPPASGKTLLQQFLRLKVAGDMLGGQGKGVMEGLRQELAQGRPVEIAGYRLSPGLAAGMEKAVLAPPPVTAAPAGRVEWMEISTRVAVDGAGGPGEAPTSVQPTLSPVSAQALAKWQAAGFTVRSQVVQGPQFWQTQEIEDAPDLVAICADFIRAGA
jgi:exosortase A-associated hydrolase 2